MRQLLARKDVTTGHLPPAVIAEVVDRREEFLEIVVQGIDHLSTALRRSDPQHCKDSVVQLPLGLGTGVADNGGVKGAPPRPCRREA